MYMDSGKIKVTVHSVEESTKKIKSVAASYAVDLG